MLKKLLSSLLCFALIGSTAHLSEAVTFSISQPMVQGVGVLPSKLPQVELNPPDSLGHVSDYFYADSPKLVVLIQDLHAHYEAQKNIAGLLEFLSGKLDGRFALAVEGASGVVNTSVIAQYPNTEVKEKALHLLMKEGELSGTEYFAAKQRAPRLLMGIEDETFYNVHQKLFQTTWPEREHVIQSLEKIESNVHALQKQMYNRKLKKFHNTLLNYEKGNWSNETYVRFLIQIATEIGMRDIEARYPKLVELTKGYGGLADTAHEALISRQLDQVLHEAKVLTYRLKQAMVEKENSKLRDFLQIENDLDLLSRMTRLQATELEVRDFAPRMNQFLAIAQTLLKSNPDTLQSIVSSSLDFYVMALARNPAMVKNTLALIGVRAPISEKFKVQSSKLTAGKSKLTFNLSPLTLNSVVLVAGGFHTRELAEEFKKQNVSYLVLTPTITELSETDHDLYIKRMNGDWLTPEEVLQKISASPTGDRKSVKKFFALSYFTPRAVQATAFLSAVVGFSLLLKGSWSDIWGLLDSVYRNNPLFFPIKEKLLANAGLFKSLLVGGSVFAVGMANQSSINSHSVKTKLKQISQWLRANPFTTMSLKNNGYILSVFYWAALLKNARQINQKNTDRARTWGLIGTVVELVGLFGVSIYEITNKNISLIVIAGSLYVVLHLLFRAYTLARYWKNKSESNDSVHALAFHFFKKAESVSLFVLSSAVASIVPLMSLMGSNLRMYFFEPAMQNSLYAHLVVIGPSMIFLVLVSLFAVSQQSRDIEFRAPYIEPATVPDSVPAPLPAMPASQVVSDDPIQRFFRVRGDEYVNYADYFHYMNARSPSLIFGNDFHEREQNWKFHIRLLENEKDVQTVLSAVVPLLEELGVGFKVLNNFENMKRWHEAGHHQSGKDITVYVQPATDVPALAKQFNLYSLVSEKYPIEYVVSLFIALHLELALSDANIEPIRLDDPIGWKLDGQGKDKRFGGLDSTGRIGYRYAPLHSDFIRSPTGSLRADNRAGSYRPSFIGTLTNDLVRDALVELISQPGYIFPEGSPEEVNEIEAAIRVTKPLNADSRGTSAGSSGEVRITKVIPPNQTNDVFSGFIVLGMLGAFLKDTSIGLWTEQSIAFLSQRVGVLGVVAVTILLLAIGRMILSRILTKISERRVRRAELAATAIDVATAAHATSLSQGNGQFRSLLPTFGLSKSPEVLRRMKEFAIQA